jgi:hypothetical protein
MAPSLGRSRAATIFPRQARSLPSGNIVRGRLYTISWPKTSCFVSAYGDGLEVRCEAARDEWRGGDHSQIDASGVVGVLDRVTAEVQDWTLTVRSGKVVGKGLREYGQQWSGLLLECHHLAFAVPGCAGLLLCAVRIVMRCGNETPG